jgi:hypothetical protein
MPGILLVLFAVLAACQGRVELGGVAAAHDDQSDGGDEDITQDTGNGLCPGPVVTTPLTTVELAAGSSTEEEVEAWLWALTGMPSGSSASPPAPENSAVAYFTPDLAGLYTITLTAFFAWGRTDTCTVTVTAVSGRGLRVEMFWNPPEDPLDTSDVDLHLLHPDAPAWFHFTDDCFYQNCDSRRAVLDWDMPGPADDPSLDLDDVDGFGPENINVAQPLEWHPYTVGVHYYYQDTMDEAVAFVKIYCGLDSVTPVFSAGPVTLRAVGPDNGDNDFWKVAVVTWTGVACSVEPLDEIVPSHEAKAGR